MNFVDTISVLKNSVWSDCRDRRTIAKNCDRLIKNQLEGLDILQSAIEETNNQIKVWEDEQNVNPKANYQNQIVLFRIIEEFYKVNGRLALIEIDINTAYKYLFTAKTDYEYRFFARRIYTLLYEADDGLVKPVGGLMPKLKSVIDNDRFEQYKKEHKKFNAFLVRHHGELKKTRNTNEAHKGEDFKEQVLSIENLSVAHSIEVIQEGNVLLANLNAAFIIVLGGLMAYMRNTFK